MEDLFVLFFLVVSFIGGSLVTAFYFSIQLQNKNLLINNLKIALDAAGGTIMDQSEELAYFINKIKTFEERFLN